MKYITGYYALNVQLPGCKTTGDWHSYILNNLEISETKDRKGLVWCKKQQTNCGTLENVWIATHERAVYDLIEQGWETGLTELWGCVSDYLDGNTEKLLELIQRKRKQFQPEKEYQVNFLIHEFGITTYRKLWGNKRL